MPENPSEIDRLRLAGVIQGSGTELANTSTTGTSGDQDVLKDINGTCESGSRMNIVSFGITAGHTTEGGLIR